MARSVVTVKIEEIILVAGVKATVAGELFRAAVRAREGEDQSELLLPMDAVDQRGWLGWEQILYIAAAVALLRTTSSRT